MVLWALPLLPGAPYRALPARGPYRAGQDPEPPPPGAPRGWGDALGPGLWAPRLGFGWLGFGWLACLLGFRLDSGLDFGLDFSFWLDLARFWFGLIWIWLDFAWISA